MGRRSPYQDRGDAGRRLAELLKGYRGRRVVVLAVPRGGVPVAVEVAEELDAPLDVVIPRKLAIPSDPEAGYGAVTEDGTLVLNDEIVQQLRLNRSQIEEQAERVRSEVQRRSEAYRGGREPAAVSGKTAIIVDDGLATGYTMMAAVKSMERSGAAAVIAAAPVGTGHAVALIRPMVSELVCPIVSHAMMFAVAGYYHNWHDLDDGEVLGYLDRWREKWLRRHPAGSSRGK